MKYAIVQSGIVTNVLRGPAPEGTVQIPDGVYVTPGYNYDGASFTPPTEQQLNAAANAEFDNGVDDTAKLFKIMKAIALWNAQLHGITPANAKSQIVAIYRAL